MKFFNRTILVALYFLFPFSAKAQNTGIKPQYWNNLSVDWAVNDNLWVGSTISYNILIDRDFPWSELTYNGMATFRLNSFILGNGGLYIAASNQSEELKSLEMRPYIGVRLSTKVDKRWIVSNLSRLEWRNMIYSNDTKNITFRFRNRTTTAIAINQNAILNNNTLYLFAYFEAFHNFEKEVVERYFTTLKYKIGLAYRFSPKWRIDLGTLFNQARSTIVAPSQAPTNLITNVIIEWGVTYGIQARN